jgi:phage terminase large subunit-like protein
VLVFQDEKYLTVVPWFWVPEEEAAKRSTKDRVPYQEWIRQGLITPTPGNIVDQGFIREDINRLAKEYRLKELSFDPWNATKLAVELGQHDGIKVVEIRQGFANLSEPTKDLGALVKGKTLRHGGHPVLRWMAGNMVVKQDPIGNLVPDKSKVTEKIDGIVALIMAIGSALRNKDKEPEYQMFIYGGH